MVNKLKQYWFLVLVGVLLVSAFGYVTYEENKGKIPGKSSNGQAVVFSIGDLNVTAEMLYEEAYKNGDVVLMNRLNEIIVRQAVTATKDMEAQAKLDVENVLKSFKDNYGDQWEAYLQSAMQQAGIASVDELPDYFLLGTLRAELNKQYFNKDLDKYYAAYAAEKNPRLISHILVKMADPKNPTKEELDKVKAVEEALKTKDFGDVATELSDDTGSAQNKGSVGLTDKDTSFVPEFLAKSLELKTGEVSEWVKTTYGWHMIKCDSAEKADIIKHADFYKALDTFNSKMNNQILWDTAKELGMDFLGNTQLEARIMKLLEVK